MVMIIVTLQGHFTCQICLDVFFLRSFLSFLFSSARLQVVTGIVTNLRLVDVFFGQAGAFRG